MTRIQLCTDKLKIHDDVVTRAIFRRDIVAERETSRINFRESSRSSSLPLHLDRASFCSRGRHGPRAYIPDADMRGSTHPRVPVSFCFGELFTQFSGPRFSFPREICFGLWEVRPRLRISFVEVNVFNFATEKERRATRRERDGEGWREKEVKRKTTTTRRDENDDNEHHDDNDNDNDDPALSGPSQPASSFNAFYHRETRRLLRHGSMTLRGGSKGGRKMQRGFGRVLKNRPVVSVHWEKSFGCIYQQDCIWWHFG